MKFNIFPVILIAFSTLFISCSDIIDSTYVYGKLSVQLTDTPFPHDLVAERNVTVFKVDARYKSDLQIETQSIDSTDMSKESD